MRVHGLLRTLEGLYVERFGESTLGGPEGMWLLPEFVSKFLDIRQRECLQNVLGSSIDANSAEFSVKHKLVKGTPKVILECGLTIKTQSSRLTVIQTGTNT
jgi:hypothetical protein